MANLSLFYTLQSGNLIYTGTLEGVGKVVVGNSLIDVIDGLTNLETKIV